MQRALFAIKPRVGSMICLVLTIGFGTEVQNRACWPFRRLAVQGSGWYWCSPPWESHEMFVQLDFKNQLPCLSTGDPDTTCVSYRGLRSASIRLNRLRWLYSDIEGISHTEQHAEKSLLYQSVLCERYFINLSFFQVWSMVQWWAAMPALKVGAREEGTRQQR